MRRGWDETIRAHCAEEVRRHAPDRHLAGLFAPPEARDALFALYAFDHEIAKVRHVVSQPMAGLIRLQWWRDALDGIEQDRPLAHPVVRGLHRVFRSSSLSRAHLDRAIEAREDELGEHPPASPTEVEGRLEASSAGIAQAALEILGVTGAAEIEAARRIGLARGWWSLLREFPADRRQGRVLLPETELVRHGLGTGSLLDGDLPEQVRALVSSLAARALDHLRAARRGRPVAPAALPVLLTAVPIEIGLRRLRRRSRGRENAPPSPWLPLRVLVRWMRGRF